MRDLTRYSGLGVQFAATVGLFAFVGNWLDGHWNSGPWLLITGVFLGFGLGLYSMIEKLPSSARASRRGAAEDDRHSSKNDPEPPR